jgi:hypothetical protein
VDVNKKDEKEREGDEKKADVNKKDEKEEEEVVINKKVSGEKVDVNKKDEKEREASEKGDEKVNTSRGDEGLVVINGKGGGDTKIDMSKRAEETKVINRKNNNNTKININKRAEETKVINGKDRINEEEKEAGEVVVNEKNDIEKKKEKMNNVNEDKQQPFKDENVFHPVNTIPVYISGEKNLSSETNKFLSPIVSSISSDDSGHTPVLFTPNSSSTISSSSYFSSPFTSSSPLLSSSISSSSPFSSSPFSTSYTLTTNVQTITAAYEKLFNVTNTTEVNLACVDLSSADGGAWEEKVISGKSELAWNGE